MTNNNSQDCHSYQLPPNPQAESEETIKDYEEKEITRRALRIAQDYIELHLNDRTFIEEELKSENIKLKRLIIEKDRIIHFQLKKLQEHGLC